MNKPAGSLPPRDAITPSYGTDSYGWAMTQARFIRERRLELIDWDNIAAEIESVGRSERRSAESALRVVLLHRLKWEYQPLFRSRSWANSIKEPLRQFGREIADNPSLTPHLDSIREEAYHRARYEAGQETGLLLEGFPAEPPAWDAIRTSL